MKGRLSILIVEDVSEMRELLKFILSGVQGVWVSGLAKNGFEARMEASRSKPDLVLLDEVLSGESSYDLLNEFCLSGMPVLLMTGMESPSPDLPLKALGRMLKPGWKSIEEDRARIQKVLVGLGAIQ